MGDLVADHRPDRSEVGGRVGLIVEERGLENTRRKDDLVGGRVVEGVDDLWRDGPFRPVDRFAGLLEVAAGVSVDRTQERLEVRITDLDRLVTLPGVGIADLDRHRVKLLERDLLGLVGHPCVLFDPDAERGDQGIDKRRDLLLGLGWEIFRDIKLTDRFSNHPAGLVEGSLL